MPSNAEGGFYVRQREPDPANTTNWRPPFRHETLEQAFAEAERVSRLKGCSFSVLQEVGVVEPVLREEAPAPEESPTRQKLAFLQEQLTDIQAAIADLANGGGR